MNENDPTAVVTGASAGIGRAVAIGLARQGWRVICLGRDPVRSAAALEAIQDASPDRSATMIVADLSVMSEADRAVRAIAAMTGHIEVLVNNAGSTGADRRETSDGYEAVFAGNHLGPFLLTTRLLPLLRAGKARIVNVSSMAHRFVQGMAWDDLQLNRGYSANRAYAQSKLANILFTRALAAREANNGIVVSAAHPGMVGSNFASHGSSFLKFIYLIARPFTLRPTDAADTILWLATAVDAGDANGGYFIRRAAAKPSLAATDEASADRLWKESEALIAKAEETTAVL